MAEPSPTTPITLGLRTTGIIPSQGIADLIRTGEIASLSPIDADQIQPASLDLRLGPEHTGFRPVFCLGQKQP